MGKEANGSSSITLFKAFMLKWVAASMGLWRVFWRNWAKMPMLKFPCLNLTRPNLKRVRCPLVHPGPFKNIGSSLLPSLLKESFEKEIGGDACVPLGLLGHELDAASQAQNQKIIDHVLHGAKFDASIDKATPLVRVSEGFVTVSCQVFGKMAFLSFTLAAKND